MNTEVNKRFRGLPFINIVENKQALVVGAGGIGSSLTILLARLGMRVTVIDFDRVEMHNLGGQLFSIDDIGLYKAEAIAVKAYEYSTNENVKGVVGKFELPEKFVKENDIHVDKKYIRHIISTDYDFVFAVTDNFESRYNALLLAGKIAQRTDKEVVLIDARLALNFFDIYYVKMRKHNANIKVKFHAATINDDRAVDEGACTLRQTSYMAFLLTGMITDIVTTAMNEQVLESDFGLKYMYKYTGSLMSVNVFDKNMIFHTDQYLEKVKDIDYLTTTYEEHLKLTGKWVETKEQEVSE